ncbi:hypothetical protein PsorP6_001669 [Peronosclerospora sorghi]|uniref:Uncharacterized protein n=1 Tax=Peronosclerospora sorghi TaxID=230839 RepID=A0ACC0WVZ2_9STRA|nr:hypothetical protein PsorP6_001669 [Peronosclerospora sorghi]
MIWLHNSATVSRICFSLSPNTTGLYYVPRAGISCNEAFELKSMLISHEIRDFPRSPLTPLACVRPLEQTQLVSFLVVLALFRSIFSTHSPLLSTLIGIIMF